MRTTICLPTYNERDNVEPMLRALGEVLREGDRVLVVDDASPDGTGELADRLAAELPYVDVLHRESKEGLGPAYIAGFRRALADGFDLVLGMDCDFSHDPADVPRLIAAAEDGADLVLGSRYVPGGSIPNWALARRAVSRAGNLYARHLARSRSTTSPAATSATAARCSRASTSTRSRRRATPSRSRRRTAPAGPASA